MAKFRIVYSVLADKDLLSILKYLKSNWGEKTVGDFESVFTKKKLIFLSKIQNWERSFPKPRMLGASVLQNTPAFLPRK